MASLSAARRLNPPRVLALSILCLILAGAVLLWLPLSSAPGHATSFFDALFTATSAVCLTGLIVVDTSTEFSTFGLTILGLLIQAGGLGYMTISTVIAVALGRAVSIQERLALQEALNVEGTGGLLRFAGTVFKLTLAFELAGAAILTVRWWTELGPVRAAGYGLFHSVSAFNNAGFALWSDSLTRWRGDLTVNLVMTALIICGGLGFLVLSEILDRPLLDRIIRPFRRPRPHRRVVRLSVHTKLALAATVALLTGGTVVFWALEAGNPATLGALEWREQWLAAWFQSVTARTAGFNTIDTGALLAPAAFVTMALMFIGAAPGSTGGGVKVTTFSIIVVALWATVRGNNDPHLFARRLPADLVARAFFVCLIAFLGLNVVAGVVLVTEGRDLLRTLFETISAFGTVGLSMGEHGSATSLSAFFTPAGRVLMMVMMFAGRIGPLTLAFAVARRATNQARVEYPEGRISIG